jgi:hypothetical protein
VARGSIRRQSEVAGSQQFGGKPIGQSKDACSSSKLAFLMSQSSLDITAHLYSDRLDLAREKISAMREL